jgi:hypothetical protein
LNEPAFLSGPADMFLWPTHSSAPMATHYATAHSPHLSSMIWARLVAPPSMVAPCIYIGGLPWLVLQVELSSSRQAATPHSPCTTIGRLFLLPMSRSLLLYNCH